MTTWLRLGEIQIGGGDDDAAERHDLRVSVGSIDLGGSGSNANATASIDGVPNALRLRLLKESVGAACTIYRDAVAIYSGTIDVILGDVGSRVLGLELQS